MTDENNKNEKMVKVTVTMESDHHNKLLSMASKTERSVSYFVRHAVSNLVEKWKNQDKIHE